MLFSGIAPNEAAQISILKNNGDGTWDADVIAADGITGNLELVNADGSTELISSPATIYNLDDLEISDVDNNGYQDLLVYSGNNSLFVLENYVF